MLTRDRLERMPWAARQRHLERRLRAVTLAEAEHIARYGDNSVDAFGSARQRGLLNLPAGAL